MCKIHIISFIYSFFGLNLFLFRYPCLSFPDTLISVQPIDYHTFFKKDQTTYGHFIWATKLPNTLILHFINFSHTLHINKSIYLRKKLNLLFYIIVSLQYINNGNNIPSWRALEHSRHWFCIHKCFNCTTYLRKSCIFTILLNRIYLCVQHETQIFKLPYLFHLPFHTADYLHLLSWLCSKQHLLTKSCLNKLYYFLKLSFFIHRIKSSLHNTVYKVPSNLFHSPSVKHLPQPLSP